MIGEKEKGLKILIAEDCGFDAVGAYQYSIQERKEIEEYRTFPIRLTEALKNKGYQISKVTVIPEWKKENNILLPNYDVIISDFQFPTDCDLSLEEILQQPEIQEKMEEKLKSFQNLLMKYAEEYGRDDYHKESLKQEAEERIRRMKYQGDEWYFWKKGKEGFLPLGLEAKKIGKKVTYFTSKPGHGFGGFVVGMLYDLFAPEDAAETMAATWGEERFLRDYNIFSSKKGNLLVGKKEVGDMEEDRKACFNNWIKAVEIATEYQTK